MKKRERNYGVRGGLFGRLLLWLSSVAVMLLSFPPPLQVYAAGLVQTQGDVSCVLQHTHGDNCYGTIYVICSGPITTISDTEYICDTCGTRFYTAGPSKTGFPHGYNTRGLSCTQSGDLGSFAIHRELRDGRAYLSATIDECSDLISEYSISWNADGAYSEGGAEILPVRAPGTYTASLHYYDEQSGDWHDSALSFTELTAPVHVEYRSLGEKQSELDLEYGDYLPPVEVLQRTGYIFTGYYAGASRYYDASGDPADSGTEALKGYDLYLDAAWEAMKFPFYYGEDADGDGKGDSVAYLEYGEAPPPLDVGTPAERPGMDFKGYYIGDVQVYDTEGNPTGNWNDIPGGELALTERWEEVRYYLHYGSYSEQSFSYDDPLPATVPVPEQEGKVFDGFYYKERMIYDESGRLCGELPELHAERSVTLTDRWHTKSYVIRYGEDADGDGVPDQELEILYGEELPDIQPALPEPKEGYEFEGYTVNGEPAYDALGEPIGEWRPDLSEGDYTLKPVWKPKEYTVYYGEDEDGDGLPDKQLTLTYDETPGDLDLPPVEDWTGYVFLGYFVDGIQVFDENGKAVGEWTGLLTDSEQLLEARWHRKEFRLLYGGFYENDRPVNSVVIQYGEELPRLNVGEADTRKGYDFVGYFVGEHMLYDAQGDPCGDWDFTELEGTYSLERRWEPKSYRIQYTSPDGSEAYLEVVYGEPYDAVAVPELAANTVFDGYSLRDELVFDDKGQPTGLWRWDVDTEGSTLALLSHELPKRVEPTPTPEPSPTEEPEPSPTEEPSPADDEEEPTPADEEDEPTPVKRDDNKHGGNSSGGDAGGEAVEAVIPYPAVEPVATLVPSPADILPAEEDSVSENAVSDNSVSGNSTGKKNGKKALKQSAAADDSGWDGEDDDPLPLRRGLSREDDNGPEREEEPVEEAVPDERAAAAEMPKEPESEDDSGGSLSSAGNSSISERKAAALPVIKKVAKVGAATVGGLGGVFAIYAGLIYLLAMVEIDTICPDGRRKRLGRLTIHSDKGKAFLVRISRELLEQCETDTLCLRIPALFAMHYRDRTIVVQSRGKKQEKKIGREIRIRI